MAAARVKVPVPGSHRRKEWLNGLDRARRAAPSLQARSCSDSGESGV